MLRRSSALAAALILFAPIAWHSPAGADSVTDELEATKRAAVEADLAAALEVLEEASEFLAKQKNFSFSADTGNDVLQRGGFLLEFGKQREFTVRRPDSLRVDVTERNGESHITRYDGRRFSVMIPDENAYVSIDVPGGIDAMLEAMERDFDTSVPLSDWIHTKLYDELAPKIDFAMIVGPASIGGHECDHVFFRTPELDFQLWVQIGDQPLIRRMVLTYKRAAASPQFWAQIDEWKLGGKPAADAIFEFSPPEGAERIPMRAVPMEKGGMDR